MAFEPPNAKRPNSPSVPPFEESLGSMSAALDAAWRRFWDDRRPNHGSALAEFALAFPLQLFVTFGILQLILIAMATLMVNHAAHVAARAAVVGEDPARAAAIVLTPLAGYADPRSGAAELSRPLAVPGWGALRHGSRAVEKVHVRLNDHPDPLPVRDSPFTIADPNAYADVDRFTETALRSREAVASAFGDGDEARVVVEFDFELLFPVVDALYALFYRSASQSSAGDGKQERAAFGAFDEHYRESASAYSWSWEPGRGFAGGIPRVRMIGGRRHLLLARESTLYRGFPLR